MSDDIDSNWSIYKRLLVYVKPLKFFFILSVIGNAIYAAASALMAKALEFVIQTVENPTDENRILLPALIIALFAMRGLGGFLGGYYIAYSLIRVHLATSFLVSPITLSRFPLLRRMQLPLLFVKA